MIEQIIASLFAVTAVVGYFNRRAGYVSIFVVSAAFMISYLMDLTYMGFFPVIASIVWMIVSLFSYSYGERYGKWLTTMLSVTILGMAIILSSDNYLTLIAGWEIMSVPSYVIVGLNKKNDGPPFVFMLFSELSTMFIILGAAYSYVATGSLQFVPETSYITLFLVAVGALIKMGMSPFMISEWLPIAHGNAPSNASAVLSATMTLMGVFLIVRVMLLSPQNIYLGIIFLIIGAISILFASIYAYVSENMKMLAGFSTIENNAAILSAAGLYMIVTSHTLQLFILYTIIMLSLAHSIGKTGIFLSIGNTRGEHFSQIKEKTNTWNNLGMLFSTMSLSGLLPTIGGLGVWMLLESFFMEAYYGGFNGISAIVAGSIIALGEGMASGAMMKLLSFSSIFRREKERRKGIDVYAVLGTGVFLIILSLLGIYIIPASMVSGLPSVLVFNGFMIESRFGPADFGLLTPDYIAFLIASFSLVAYAVFRKPSVRSVPVWNGGREETGGYTSYAYSNNIKLMLKKLLRTSDGSEGGGMTIIDVFWTSMTDVGISYRRFCRFVTLRFMNSSIGWYMVYMIGAFMGTLIIFVIINSGL